MSNNNMADLTQCYNKGCGQKYTISENGDDTCQFHPGQPVFHDAMKGWSCCKKRSTDFTEFLNIPGCTKGKHSDTKPVEPIAKKEKSSTETVTRVPQCPKPMAAPMERPSADAAMVRLKTTVGSTLKDALNKLSLNAAEEKSEGVSQSQQVTVGTSCKNNACSKSYVDESSDIDTCMYHSGCPIFHEGMKYWTCCQRKTTEFDNFLAQAGCTEGKHVWIKESQKKVDCRYDWHQTAQFVTISLFAKLTKPEKSWVSANSVSIKIHIVYDGGKSEFTKEITLKGVVNPELSQVKMLGSKIEVNLRKAEPGSWSGLELPREAPASSESSDEDVDFE